MIQRIQTVYLFLALVVLLLMFFFSLGTLSFGQERIMINIYGFSPVGGEAMDQAEFDLGFFALLPLSVLLLLVDIFLFRNRAFQYNVIRFVMVLEVLLTGLTAYALWGAPTGLEGQPSLTIGFGSILPPIALILTFLAGKGVKKDEKLVRSVDRLRD